MSKTKKIILSGLLLGLLIVLSRFISIKTPIIVISFSFIPIMISAYILGPLYSCLVAALGDLIGALLFPFGEYFVGFTIVQGLVGFVYGIVLYKKDGFFTGKKLIFRLVISSILVLGIIELLIMSLMLHFLYGSAFIAILSTRLITKLIMLPIQILVMYFLSKYIVELTNKYLITEN